MESNNKGVISHGESLKAIESFTKALLILSKENDLKQLLSKMIALLLDKSETEKGVILIKQEKDWFIQSQWNIKSKEKDVLLNQLYNSAESGNKDYFVPKNVFSYCLRSKEVLILGDAQQDHRFSENSIFQNKNIKSLACIPVLFQGNIKAMMYLENSHLSDAFTQLQIDVIKHLSSLFAVFIENQMIYNVLNKKIHEIQESEERFRNLMEQSPLPTEILTPEGKISQTNNAWRKLWNLDKKSELETLKKYNMLTDPQLEKLGLKDIVKVAFSGQPVILPPIKYDANLTKEDFDIEVLKGLKSLWIQCHLYPVKNTEGKVIYLVNKYVDITNLKRAEKQKKKSEERFRNLMEQSPWPTVIFSPTGKIIKVNSAFKKLWKLSEEEEAEVIAKYNLLTDPQYEKLGFMKMVKEAFEGKHTILPPIQYDNSKTVVDFNIESLNDFKSLWIQIHLNSMRDEKGQIDYIVSTYIDLTDLKNAEQKIQEQRDLLSRISRANEMGQLTASIAHELNQPLTGILSNAQAAELMLKSNQWDKEEFREILADIISDTKRASSVIRNLRDLYREQKVDLLPIKINSIIIEIVNLLQSEIVMNHVSLVTRKKASLPMVKGNRIQIQQVLVNLIMNGIQAMDLKQRKGRKLLITTSSDGHEVKVWVSDKGNGIDPGIIDEIFEPLTTWKPDGTGMGLAISNTIIKAHGGRMLAENRNGGGARVGFVIPVIKENEE